MKKISKEVWAIFVGKSIKILSSIKNCLSWILNHIANISVIFCMICLTICVYQNSHREVVKTEEPEVVVVYVSTPDRIIYTQMDIEELETAMLNTEYLAKCIEAEAGNQGRLGKVYVCDCILNRFETGKYKTIEEVINAPGQFACVVNGDIPITPTQETYEVIEQELKERTNSEIKYFRTERYHDFGTPCFQYGAHYFSK